MRHDRGQPVPQVTGILAQGIYFNGHYVSWPLVATIVAVVAILIIIWAFE